MESCEALPVLNAMETRAWATEGVGTRARIFRHHREPSTVADHARTRRPYGSGRAKRGLGMETVTGEVATNWGGG